MSSVTIVNCCGDGVAFQLKLWEVPVPGRRRPLDRGTGTITGQIPMGFLAGRLCTWLDGRTSPASGRKRRMAFVMEWLA